MIRIKKQKNDINSQKDAEMLDEPYFGLLKVLVNNKFSYASPTLYTFIIIYFIHIRSDFQIDH